MSGFVISDAGPLIGLAKVGALDLLRGLYRKVLIPLAVHGELALESGRPGSTALRSALEAGWLKMRALAVPRDESMLSALDPGEDEAIRLALEAGPTCRFLLIDDRRGRAVALRRGLPVVGTATVLLAAKERAKIPEVRPLLDALASAGYRLAPALRQRVLGLAGEV